MVFNWNGSTNGGGTDQLVFGTNCSALTASQLAQIDFVNPGGFAGGTYPSRILSTGEVVPTLPPTLFGQRSGTNLLLSWAGNFVLQSATNVTGPYLDVTNATSPYTNSLKLYPQQFFLEPGGSLWFEAHECRPSCFVLSGIQRLLFSRSS